MAKRAMHLGHLYSLQPPALVGVLLEDVVVLQSVRPQGLLPHEDEDLHPPGVAELEGLDVVEVHGAVSVGQSGLPARGAASSAAEEGA